MMDLIKEHSTMQSSDRSETPRAHGEWVVSPLASEASTLSTDAYCTVSPPPYTPTESMSQQSRCVDEKYPAEDVGGMYREQSRSRTNLNRSIRDDTPDRSPSTLPEVVYCELPEVVPSTFPEVVHSTLPQAAHSDLPQVVTSAESRVDHSSLPEATTGLVLGCNMDQEMTISAPPPTVSPLHLLGDQPDFIDCPFCQQQTKTTVKKKPSNATQ